MSSNSVHPDLLSVEKPGSPVPVLIVGAGPTGLNLALWLTRLGIRVRIIDKIAEAGTTSRAIAVVPRTLEFYRQLGIAEDLVAGGHKVPGINFWVKGSKQAHVPMGNMGEGLTPFPFMLCYSQDEHERLLVQRLEELGVSVERRTTLASFVQTEKSVQASLQREDGSNETCEATYLAGCDGASSMVRQTLGTGFPGGTYSALFYVADVIANGPAVNGEININLDEADFIAIFPLMGQNRIRLVGTVRNDSIEDKHQLTFEDVSDRVIRSMKFTIEKVNWFSTYRVHHRVASRFREGRVFLLGDAAHVHSPVGGQGMNTGIGDAVNLAWKLADVLNGQADQRLLESYEPERIEFARRLVATTDRVFTLVTNQSSSAQFGRMQIAPRILPLLFKVSTVRRFLFRTMSQIIINYRKSPLSDGAAARVRGGDRLPWIEIAPGKDNFAPLTSLKWQVHVCGNPSTGLETVCAKLGLRLHAFEWQPKMNQAGLVQDAIYLVRPDGYIAFASTKGEPELLNHYFENRCMRLQSSK